MQEADIEEVAKTFQKYKHEMRANILTTLFVLLIRLLTLLCLTIEIRWLEIGLVIYITTMVIFTIISVIKDVKVYSEHKKTFEALCTAATLIEKFLHEDN